MGRAAERTVIVLGRFADPSKAPNYSSGVGECLSNALSRALMHDGRYDVWINPQLTRSVEAVLSLPSLEHADALGLLGEEHPDVDYVIAGKVTDFYHTSDLPREASRWGVFGRRSEAVAAIDLRIVDLRSRRIVGADHLNATAAAGSAPSGDIYGGVALDSYVFWSTPLGRASKSLIERTVRRTGEVVPGRVGDARIAEVIAQRRVTITGGSVAGLVDGREYFLVRPGTRDAPERLIRDVDTESPLTVYIERTGRNSATGYLRGRHSLETDLRGAILRSSLNRTPSLTRATSSISPADEE